MLSSGLQSVRIRLIRVPVKFAQSWKNLDSGFTGIYSKSNV